VDIVAETHDGRLWAVQAKCWSPEAVLPKGEIDKFLAGSGNRFDFLLLIASTRDLSRNAVTALEGRGANWLTYGDLSEYPVSWPSADGDFAPPRPSPLIPRVHQSEAVERIATSLRSEDRGQVIMPCGTGKTLVGLWTAERLRARTVLVLLPSLSLLSQTLREWARHASSELRLLAACGDQTVAETGGDFRPGELGFPVTTETARIQQHLEGDGRRVLFGTYQSLPAIADAVRRAGSSLDFLIADEAHRTAGSGPFSKVTDNDFLPARRRLFMTATPRIWKRSTTAADGIIAASMDDEALYGPVLHELKFGEAVAKGLLADYRVVVVGVDEITLHQLNLNHLMSLAGSEPEQFEEAAKRVALAQAIRKYDLRRVISYHGRVEQAASFAMDLHETYAWMEQQGRANGSLTATHVSGLMTTRTRRRRIRQLVDLPTTDRMVLANSRCLSEGVDVPALDGIAFMSPRRSAVDVVQAVGRVMRLHPGKEVGTIVIPVFVRNSDDAETALANSKFEHVWQILRALRSHDETLVAELDLAAQHLSEGRPGDSALPGRILLDFPDHLAISFVDRFSVRLVEEGTPAWPWWYGTLLRYVQAHGSAAVSSTYVDEESGRKLGSWANQQRVMFTQGQLLPEQARLLGELPGWSWNLFDTRFEANLQRLRDHVEAHGWSDMGSGPGSLTKFVNWVRRDQRRGTLPPGRAAALESIDGFRWAVRGAVWDEAYESLRVFAEEHGHVDVPRTALLPDGRPLAHWVRQQKIAHRTRGTSTARRQLLEALPGWAWPTAVKNIDEAKWNEYFGCLVRYVEATGSADAPQGQVSEGLSLGQWVGYQRGLYQAGSLPNEYAERLASLPGWVWSHRDKQWVMSYERVVAHLEAQEPAHAYLDSTVVRPPFKVRAWLRRQQTAYANGTLSSDKVAKLEDLPGWDWQMQLD
jgi:superfamily II DNA or RNA helicase